jgi:DNA-binding transcriptional regulator WhiA
MRKIKRMHPDKDLRAYIIGVALGDGNLSNPSGRGIRLRITCDARYPKLAVHITHACSKLFPDNKIGIINRGTSVDVSLYSNQLPSLLGYSWDHGPKNTQNIRIPPWIYRRRASSIACLRGLLQTDGSLYVDRGYQMINFTNTAEKLSMGVFRIMRMLGYFPQLRTVQQPNAKTKYIIRLSKDVDQFVRQIGFWKA